MSTDAPCAHLAAVVGDPPAAGADGCETCLPIGQAWVNLRQCLVCGRVGCCDSSIGQHATGHFHETGHATIRSFQPGETWRWCYVDEVASDS
jgi:uncharacterized UBP type Zn finger protein